MFWEETDVVTCESSYIMVMPPNQKGKGELCRVTENELTNYTIIFQNQKYEIIEEDEEDPDLIGDGDYGIRLVQSPTGKLKSSYRKAKGYFCFTALYCTHERGTILFGILRCAHWPS